MIGPIAGFGFGVGIELTGASKLMHLTIPEVFVM